LCSNSKGKESQISGFPPEDLNLRTGKGYTRLGIPERAFEKSLAVKTATTQTKSTDVDSIKSGVPVTCVGRFSPYSRDFSPQDDIDCLTGKQA